MTIPIGIMVTVSDIILGFQFCRTPAPGVQAWDALWDSDCRQIFRPGWVCAPFKCSQSLTPLSLNIIFTFPTSRRSKLLNTTITMLTLYLSPPLKGSTGSWKVGGVDAWGENMEDVHLTYRVIWHIWISLWIFETTRKSLSLKVKIQATLTEGTPVDLKGVFIPPKVALSFHHIVILISYS